MNKKPKRLSPKDVAPHAYQWGRDELEEMKAIIDGLLQVTAAPPIQSEQPTSTTQKRRGRKNGGGYIEEKRINGSGPYLYLRYFSNGKRKSVYVGKKIETETLK